MTVYESALKVIISQLLEYIHVTACLLFLLDAPKNDVSKALEKCGKNDESCNIIPQPSNLPPEAHNLLSTIDNAGVICAGLERGKSLKSLSALLHHSIILF